MKPMIWIPDLKHLINNDLFITCPLLKARDFVAKCKDLGINTSEEQLERFEKLGIFYPFVRVKFPKIKGGFIDIWSQRDIAIKWIEEGRIWEPSSHAFLEWDSFEEGTTSFYSIFQYYPLYELIESTTLDFGRAESLISCSEKEIELRIKDLKDSSNLTIAAHQRKNLQINTPLIKWYFEDLKNRSMWRQIAATVCQIISNRYYPQTQSDRRSILISTNRLSYPGWDWYGYCDNWSAKNVLTQIGMSSIELKTLHDEVAFDVRWIDPLEQWWSEPL